MPTASLIDDDRAELRCRPVVLHGDADVDACQAYNLFFKLRNNEPIRVARCEPVHAPSNSFNRGRIAELSKQPR